METWNSEENRHFCQDCQKEIDAPSTHCMSCIKEYEEILEQENSLMLSYSSELSSDFYKE